MENKYEQIIAQYDLEVMNTYKLRGAIMLECTDGIRMMKNYEYSERRAEIENMIKLKLYDCGYQNTDIFEKNKDNKYLTNNKYGNKYVVKKWFTQEECNMSDIKSVSLAANNLANLHNCLNRLDFDDSEMNLLPKKNILEEYMNFNQEMKRVKKYILNKKKKNQLEVSILKNIDYYKEQADMAEDLLIKLNYREIFGTLMQSKQICHGMYNHHNILMNNEDVSTINFNYAALGTQIFDVYTFTRKALEKNNWDVEFADKFIERYNGIRKIEEYELKILKILFIYPEKFRKLINNYYNGQKMWISSRITSKLENVIQNEKGRIVFNEYLRKIV